jgi:hypothetical protein
MKTNEVILRKAFSTDYEKTISLLIEVFSDSYNWNTTQKETYRQFYKRLFEKKWRKEIEEHVGYLLENSLGEIVGFLGYIYVNRNINGVDYKFCNISGWAVKEEYRKYSLDLMYPIQDDAEYIYTTLTPNPTAIKVWKKLFKAQQLESHHFAVLAVPTFNWFKSIKSYFDDDITNQLITQEDYQLIQDNKKIGATFLLFIDDKGNKCLISATLSIRKKRIRFAEINYVSNQAVLKSFFKTIVWLLSKRLLTIGCLIDKRFLSDYTPKFSKIYPSHKYYVAKNNQVPATIDHLYSEYYL